MNIEELAVQLRDFINNATLADRLLRVPPRPENAKCFPTKKVGDSVWFGDLTEGGIARSIVVAKDAKNCVLVVEVYDRCVWEVRWTPPYVNWACDWHYETAEMAVAELAKRDIEYYLPRYNYVVAAAKAAAAGDVSAFLDGFSEDEE